MSQYSRGLVSVGDGTFAYLQPDGGWGYSNAGVVVSEGEALVVDTLLDRREAVTFQAAVSARTGGARVGTVVNTHAHPDHTAGNGAFVGAEILTSTSAAEEMAFIASGQDPIGRIMGDWENHGEAGRFLNEVMGSQFDVDPATQLLPTRTFDGRLELTVGAVSVELRVVGPAHTFGDVVAWLPEQGVLFAGDVLFEHVHPMVGAVPVEALRAVCEALRALEPTTVVPGHGPLTDASGFTELIDYLDYVEDQARRRFDAGMPWVDAARDIPLGAYSGWADAERIVLTTANLYRTWGAGGAPLEEVFAQAGRYRGDRPANGAH